MNYIFWPLNAHSSCLREKTTCITRKMVLVHHPPIEIFHTPVFHTPPLDSISRLLSSRAFWSIDSSPWRLSCSCQRTETHGRPLGMTAPGKKSHIVTSYYIYDSATAQRHKSELVVFNTRPTQKDLCNRCKPERSLVKRQERAERGRAF